MPRQTTAATDERRLRPAGDLLQRRREAPHCGHIVFFDVSLKKTMALVLGLSQSRQIRARERRGT